jgi:uncharacterized membrane protein YhaH (DUF805 family)
MSYYVMALKRFWEFGGRSSRREYWMFILVNFLICLLIEVVEAVLQMPSGTITFFYALFICIPSLALQIRRLHDIGMSAWWVLLYFIPFIGGVILLICNVIDGQMGANRYGLDPKIT